MKFEKKTKISFLDQNFSIFFIQISFLDQKSRQKAKNFICNSPPPNLGDPVEPNFGTQRGKNSNPIDEWIDQKEKTKKKFSKIFFRIIFSLEKFARKNFFLQFPDFYNFGKIFFILYTRGSDSASPSVFFSFSFFCEPTKNFQPFVSFKHRNPFCFFEILSENPGAF